MKKELISLIDKGIEHPVKTISLIILIMIISVAAIVLNNQKELIWLIIRDKQIAEYLAELDHDRFEEQISRLIANTNAVNGTIWTVDLAEATKEVLYSYHHQTGIHERKQYLGQQASLYSDNQDAKDMMIDVHRGNIACTAITNNSYVEKAIAKSDKVTHVCTISVPPKTGAFMGLITVGFNSPPKITHAFITDMRKASKGIITQRMMRNGE